MDYLLFDLDYLDIPFQDLSPNTIVVCHDPQHRCNDIYHPEKKTWAVVKTFSNVECPPTALGLFWEQDMAETFADAMCH